MPKYILIVDNCESIRNATRQSLEGQPGCEVCGEAFDGLDALEKARLLMPDLIILDLVMPRMNGLQAARELREMMAWIPIILFTLHADAVPPHEAQAAGIRAVISKMDVPALHQHIETLFAA
jgi:DNA-binding NarL/FixJ family response regulator